MANIYIKVQYGIGDCFYQIPIIENIVDVYDEVFVETPWPQIMNLSKKLNGRVKYVRPVMPANIKIQNKNTNDYAHLFVKKSPNGMPYTHLTYQHHSGMNHLQAMFISVQNLKISEKYYLDLQLPELEKQNTVIVRPALIRKDWPSPGRNTKQAYIQFAINACNSLGYETIVMADVKDGIEDYAEFRPENATRYIEKAELSLLESIDLVRRSQFVIGCMGMYMGLCVAVGTPMVCIMGGAGGLEHPDIIHVPGKGKIHFVLPDNFCMCKQYTHPCNKTLNPRNILKAITEATNDSTK